MVGLVQRMLALYRQLAAASIPADKTLYQRQIDATDCQIDRLVYGLTDIDILLEQALDLIAGCPVGLISNAGAVTRELISVADMHAHHNFSKIPIDNSPPSCYSISKFV